MGQLKPDDAGKADVAAAEGMGRWVDRCILLLVATLTVVGTWLLIEEFRPK
jgi:hypothetical protein